MPMSSFILQMVALLVYENVRKFGTMETSYLSLSRLFFGEKIGPEPAGLDFKEPAFKQLLKIKRNQLKSALLDQEVVALRWAISMWMKSFIRPGSISPFGSKADC